MTKRNIVLFPDTNYFFQCREPNECPWDEIIDASEITLAVCRTVRSEIDKHKAGKDRLARRARMWTSRLREASRNGGRTTLREAPPRIVLWVTPPAPRLQKIPEELDPYRPDDRIIADILALQVADPTLSNAIFFTDDGGAADTARHVGLNSIDIPLDEDGKIPWRQPREADGSERRIRQLEAQIRGLMERAPSIAIRAFNAEDEQVEELPIHVTRFRPLADDEVAQLAAQAEAQNPKVTEFGVEPPPITARQHHFLNRIVPLGQVWRPPNSAEITDYAEIAYPEWQAKIRKFYTELHERLETLARSVRMSISIGNEGNVPAENTAVTFEALGGLIFMSPPEDGDKSGLVDFTLPYAPAPPKGKYVSRTALAMASLANRALTPAALPDHFSTFTRLSPPPPRERTSFYWRDRDDSTEWRADCTELRHKVKAAKFDFLIVVPSDRDTPRKAAIRCTVSASNIPEPATFRLKVPIAFSDGDTGNVAIKILHAAEPWQLPIGHGLPPI